mgnify:CR=1 FL=1
MDSIFTIAGKDIKQMVRDFKSFLFLLIMPIAFTFLFGLAFKGNYEDDIDHRLTIGVHNLDTQSQITTELIGLFKGSTAITPSIGISEQDLLKQLSKETISAVVLIPDGYGESLLSENPMKLKLMVDENSSNGLSAQTEIATLTNRLLSSIHTAQTLVPEGGSEFEVVLGNALAAWQNPPVKLVNTTVVSPQSETSELTAAQSSFAHSSPAMILQFAVAGLVTCAQVIILERKNRCLQRLITTATSRVQILLGHYLGIFGLLLLQFIILIVFGDLVLKLNYHAHWLATLVIAVTSALCVAALGLLIGVIAKGEEQGIAFSLICMFVLSALGGAWVPLEVTGETFQILGHISPLAWGMDGFKNILIRGQGINSALIPGAVLMGYTFLFFTLAALKFRKE